MALSTFFLGVLLLLALFYQRYTEKREFVTITGRGLSLRPLMVGSWRYAVSESLLRWPGHWDPTAHGDALIGSFMRLYGFFGVKSPLTMHHWLTAFRDPLFLGSLKNTLIIGFGVASAGVAIYALLAYSIVRLRVPFSATIGLLAWLPCAVPGILLGVALLWLLLSIPGAVVVLRHDAAADYGVGDQRDADRDQHDEGCLRAGATGFGRCVAGLRCQPI